MKRLARGLLLLAIVAVAAFPGAVSAGAAPAPGVDARPEGCTPISPGTALSGIPWAENQLNFRSLWSITEGRSVTTGRPVRIAVIDTGFDQDHPQLQHVDYTPTFDAVTRENDSNRVDCDGHGTQVTSIIAAQPSDTSAFYGVAPQAQILPIKYTNTSGTDTSGPIVRAFEHAVAERVDIINFSSGATNQLGPAFLAVLRAAERANILVVVAGGNDKLDSGNQPIYPAAYSTMFPNMIAVSAVDESGSTGDFSSAGNYIDVAAPGVGVETATRWDGNVKQGFGLEKGTSFAAPFVTGTAALMLAAHPGMSPESIRDRIEATADPPPGAVRDNLDGYGILNPTLAVTGTQNDTVTLPPPTRGAALPAPRPPRSADHSLQHHALAIALILLGLAALFVAGAATLRGNRPVSTVRPASPSPADPVR